MSIPVQVLDIYKYYIEKITLTSPNWTKPYEINGQYISTVAILNSYDGNIAPQISVDCTVDYDVYYEILEKAKNISASFIISKAKVGTTAEQPKTSVDKAAFTQDWVRCDLKATDQGYLYSRDVVENTRDQNVKETKNGESSSLKQQIKLFLYDAKKLVKYRKNKSFVINGNMNDCLYELLNSREFDTIIMSSAPDEEKIDYAIPLGDLGQNLTDLNEIYGIYNSTYLFYLGLDRTYLLNNGNIGKDTEYGELGIVNIYLEAYDSKESAAIYAGCYTDDINKIYILGSYDVTIDNIDTLEDFASGSKIITAVSGGTTKFEDKVGTYEVEKSYLIQNPKMRSQIIQKLNESKRTLTMTVKNIDLSIITPNKKYVVLANEKFYDNGYNISGDHRLSASTITLMNDGNGTFSTTVSLVLTKI